MAYSIRTIMEGDHPLNFDKNQRSDGGRQLDVPSSTYAGDRENATTEELEQCTVFISQDETMSELKERLHIEQFRTVVFVNSHDLEESQHAREEKQFLVGFTFARVEFRDTENPAMKVKGYIAVQTDIDTKSGKLYIEKKETEVMIAEMMLTDKSWKGSNSTCCVMKHFQSGKKLAYKFIKKQASVNEVLACLELQDTETAPAVFCIKENKNIEIFMELIAPKVSLSYVIKNCMQDLLEDGLAKRFVYYMINNLLKAVNEIHSKDQCHRDLHGSNILLQHKNQRIIVRIIDYGSAIETADNDKGLENKKADLHKISEGISSLSRRCKGIEDDTLDKFRDYPRLINTTEEANIVIQETSAQAEEFANIDANKVIDRIFTSIGKTRTIPDSDLSDELKKMNIERSAPSSSDDYPYGSSSSEKSKEIPPNPSTEEAMDYMTVQT